MLGAGPCVSSCGPVELLCEERLGLPEVDMDGFCELQQS